MTTAPVTRRRCPVRRRLQHPGARSRFHVALSVRDEAGYETRTRRTVLITHTLVLSDDAAEEHTEDRGARRRVWAHGRNRTPRLLGN